jgi:hypothetical protein
VAFTVTVACGAKVVNERGQINERPQEHKNKWNEERMKRAGATRATDCLGAAAMLVVKGDPVLPEVVGVERAGIINGIR